LGGGMRQAGFLAAGCLYALDRNFDRLAEDHDHARRLAEGLRALPEVEVTNQATNMVFARFPERHCQPLEAWLAERGILAQVVAESRFVTHLDVTRADVDRFLASIQQYFAQA
jgi:threonine aldolase